MLVLLAIRQCFKLSSVLNRVLYWISLSLQVKGPLLIFTEVLNFAALLTKFLSLLFHSPADMMIMSRGRVSCQNTENDLTIDPFEGLCCVTLSYFQICSLVLLFLKVTLGALQFDVLEDSVSEGTCTPPLPACSHYFLLFYTFSPRNLLYVL